MNDKTSTTAKPLTLRAEDISSRRVMVRRRFLQGALLGAAVLPGLLQAQAGEGAAGQVAPATIERGARAVDGSTSEGLRRELGSGAPVGEAIERSPAAAAPDAEAPDAQAEADYFDDYAVGTPTRPKRSQ